MKRCLWSAVLVGILALAVSGCAGSGIGTPPQVKETKSLLEKARAGGAEKQCPSEFKDAWSTWEKAERLCPCNRKKAEGIAEQALAKAAALCTDSDGDGVADERDECPDTPYGIDVDQYGCSLDSDSDGVPDIMDACPDTPGGVEVDDDGCPLDADGDGVPDFLDRCPDTPVDASVNTNGCWIIGTVNFDTNKTILHNTFLKIFDEVVKVMKANPDLNIIIQGYTDSVGSSEYNLRLSEKRAEAVRQYLLKKGVDSRRLQTEGLGEAMPVSSNQSPEGRAKNRRVDLQPVW